MKKELLMNTFSSSRQGHRIGRLWSLLALAPLVLGMAVLFGCEQDSDVEDAAEDVGESVEDAAEEAGDATEEAMD